MSVARRRPSSHVLGQVNQIALQRRRSFQETAQVGYWRGFLWVLIWRLLTYSEGSSHGAIIWVMVGRQVSNTRVRHGVPCSPPAKH